jgi:hypothetical protein
MIKPSIFNAINFSPDFTRESKYFDVNLQRVRNIFSMAAGYLSFYFKPDVMPGATPTATFTIRFDDGNTGTASQSGVVVLTDGYVFFFELDLNYSVERGCYFQVTVDGYDDVIFSEKCRYIPDENLVAESIVTIIASNSDDTYGYISTYPACGFFEVSKLNENVFGNSKVEYNYSYGRKKILSSENFIKTRLTFQNLSMYQQNLLKVLCNCETLTIDGVVYYLVSDFTEKNKSDENEICDLQADFVLISDPTFFATGSTSVPSSFEPTNLFIS